VGILDLIIVVFLAMGAFSGFRQGLFVSLLSMVAFFIGIILAFQFMDWGARILAEKIDEMTFLLPFLSFLLIFIVVVFSIRTLAFLVKKTIDFTLIGPIDSFAGAVLGILKSAFGISILLWIMHSFEFDLAIQWAEESKFYPYIQPIAPFLLKLLDVYFPVAKDAIETVRNLVKEATNGLVD
jgi:membrane protein required for colicin V production